MLILHFESYIKFNFNLISVLNQFRDMKFLLSSNFDYFANYFPNHSIFDSVDSQLSYLSHYHKLPNFYSQFVIRFDRISKISIKFP